VRPRRFASLVLVLAATGACAERSAPGGEPPRGASAATTAPPPGSASAAIALDAGAAGSAQRVAPAGMLHVPAGTFTMGADAGGEPDEHPAHKVAVEAFWLDATEVPNEAYARCVEAGACGALDPRSADKNGLGPDARFRGPRQPVSAISWSDARAYCAWVGKRLPTEAEWEHAARGDDGRRYPWGDDAPTKDHAVFATSVTCDVGTHPKGDGPYGHHDLAGNVWEWVEDPYDPLAYQRPRSASGAIASCDDALVALADLRRMGKQGFTGSNPIPTECERVLRGGAFNYPKEGLRSSNRVHHPARYHLVMAGFRCARDAR
jgi:formylglycine-generating enzyme required for sulfatase activity